jgi:hypothetical protein
MNPAARVSPALEEAIMRSMAKNPNDRYRSMDEVLAALKRLGGALPAEPSQSITADRQSSTGSGPTASRIVLGAGAAMAIPEHGPPSGAALEGGSIPVGSPSDYPPERSGPRPVVVLGLAAIAIAGIFAFSRVRQNSAHVEATAVAPAQAPTPTPAANPASTVPPTASAKVAPEIDVSALAPASTTPASVSTTPPSVSTTIVASTNPLGPGAKPHPAALAHPAAGPAPSAAKPTSDCNPSYYYDLDGNKHFKPECFGH